jgi:hypothetical protein
MNATCPVASTLGEVAAMNSVPSVATETRSMAR